MVEGECSITVQLNLSLWFSLCLCPMTFTRFSACRATPPHHLRWDKKARGGRSQRVPFCHSSLKGSSKVFYLGGSGLCYWEGSGYISQGLLFFPCPHQEGIFFGSPLWEPGRVLGNKDHERVGPPPNPLKTGLQEFLTQASPQSASSKSSKVPVKVCLPVHGSIGCCIR